MIFFRKVFICYGALCFGLAATTGFRDVTGEARQALVVTTPGWNSVSGMLRRFEKGGRNQWKQVGRPVPVVVGKNGLAWDPSVSASQPGDPVKHEGDGRSPAGVFPITVTFGFDASPTGHAMNYTPISAGTECVDDADSRVYNQVVDRDRIPQPDWNSSEKMRGIPGYKIGAIVGYNSEQKKGAGSCIFLHIWRAADVGTAGCTAMEETSLRPILESLDAQKHPVLIQLPEAEFARFRKAWRLP